MNEGKHVLIAVDLTEQAWPVIEQGLRAARAFGAGIVLVHAVHRLEQMYGIYLGGGSVASLQEDIEDKARASLHELHRLHLADAGVAVTEDLRVGTPWTEILAATLHHDAGLIVIGAHFAAKPEHRVVGSTVERVLRHAPCPVLVVPPDF